MIPRNKKSESLVNDSLDVINNWSITYSTICNVFLVSFFIFRSLMRLRYV